MGISSGRFLEHKQSKFSLVPCYSKKQGVLLYNYFMKEIVHPPRHIVWSTDEVDVADPFQRRWLLKQVLTHGTAADIRHLDLEEVAQQIDHLKLPADIERLWRTFLKSRHG